jgi:hypothetical protein
MTTLPTSGSQNCPAGFESKTYGYSAGGTTTLIEKIQFSTESVASIATGTTYTGTQVSGGFKNNNVAGYLAGAYNSTTTICKVTISTDAAVSLVSGLALQRNMPSACSSGSNGYMLGGQGGAGGGGGNTTCQKLAFSGEACTSMASSLSFISMVSCAVENMN